MATIYLSSTYEDLKEHRQIVFEALRKAGYQVIAMEDYVAADRRPVDQCLKDVERADIYVGLFAFRYGYVPPVEHGNSKNLSITELEFQHAVTCQKPCLTFIAKEEAGIPLKFVDAYTGDGEKGTRIQGLRQYLFAQKMAGQFSAPHALANEVLAAVANHLKDHPPPEPSNLVEPPKPEKKTWNIETDGSPYPGLLHFTRKYARVFFGRESDIREILDRLAVPQNRFLIISGDSGVGKSSIVDAGVLPKMETVGLTDKDQKHWICVRMVPSQRHQPLDTLLRDALGVFINQTGFRTDELLENITKAPDTLGRHLTSILKDGASSGALLLFLDQMEELFTSQDPGVADRFLSMLYHATQEGALRVIATIRSDHLHYCHRHPDMVKVLNSHGHYALGPVQPYMVRDMILKPAQKAGLTMSEDFANRLIHDTEAASANLPVLAFVLEQLFQKRTDHELSEKVYDELGGIAGAIATHVKAVEAKIRTTVGVKLSTALPELFYPLVNLQKEEGLPTRNRQKKRDFPSHLQPVIDQLVTERLLRTEGDGDEATVAISHEKLFEAWPALKEYVETKNKKLVDRTLLATRAKKWAAMDKPWFGGLATGREYHDFMKAGNSCNALVREFLQVSRRARALWAGLGLLILVVLAGTTWLWQKGFNLEQAGLKITSVFVGIQIKPEMVAILGGTFRQGDVEQFGEVWRNPVREVTIQPFAMGKYEVTFEEYDRFAIATGRDLPNDQKWGRGRRPVMNVSWEEAKAYADWLSKQTGQQYRLPTESEWEYAARSGKKQDAWAGTSDESQLGEYAVYIENSGNRTAEVGSKQPNTFGVHDLSGNVWEWVEDCFHATYHKAPIDGTAWLETDGGDCTMRMYRGGGWNIHTEFLRTTWSRVRGAADTRGSIGFRLVQGTP